MSDEASTLKILIDIRARLDELSAAKRGLKETHEEANKLSGLLQQGLGIGSGMELVRRAIDLFKATIVDSVRESFRLAGTIKDGAENLEISRQAYQVLGEVMRDVGGDTERMAQAIALNNRSLAEARSLIGPAAAAYRTLGLDPVELERLAPERRMEAYGRAIAGAKDKTQAFAAAGDILGSRNLPTLLNALKTLGTEGYDKLAESAAKAGRIMSDDTIERLDTAEKAIEKMKRAFTIQVGETVGAIDLLRQSAAKDFGGTLWGVMRAALFGDIGGLAKTVVENVPSTITASTVKDNSAELSDARVRALKTAQLELIKLKLNQTEVDADLVSTEQSRYERTNAILLKKYNLLSDIIELTKKDATAFASDPFAQAARLAQLENERKVAGQQLGGFTEGAASRIQGAYNGINDARVNTGYLSAGQGLTAGLQTWATQAGSVGQQISGALQNTVGSQISNLSQGLVGLATHTAKWGDIGRSAGLSFLNILMQTGLQLGATALIHQGMVALHIGGESAKTAATVAGAGARTAAVTAEAGVVAGATGIAGVFRSVMELGPIAGPLVFAASIAGMIALVKGLAGREHGGSVSRGTPYIVGEKRAEVFVPEQNGTIVPSLDQYHSIASPALTYAAGASVAAGSSTSGTYSRRNQRDVVYTGSLMTAGQLMSDPDYENHFVDLAQRRRGEILGG